MTNDVWRRVVKQCIDDDRLVVMKRTYSRRLTEHECPDVCPTAVYCGDAIPPELGNLDDYARWTSELCREGRECVEVLALIDAELERRADGWEFVHLTTWVWDGVEYEARVRRRTHEAHVS